MCPMCKARGDAHFGWCVSVGGTGSHPSAAKVTELESRRARAIEGQQQAAELRALLRTLRTTPPRARSASRSRPRSNNGWLHPRRPSRTHTGDDVKSTSSHVHKKARALARPHATRPAAGELPKDLRRIVNNAIDQGWRYEPSDRGSHPRLYAPNGTGIVVLPSTPSEYRGQLNLLAELRRHGYTA